jgi:predicted subunit of tRNA(5-methylaminomethyl-2-thiouridylate) methyltransferase
MQLHNHTIVAVVLRRAAAVDQADNTAAASSFPVAVVAAPFQVVAEAAALFLEAGAAGSTFLAVVERTVEAGDEGLPFLEAVVGNATFRTQSLGKCFG